MRIEVLASGSTGNCTYIEAGGHKIMIDTGISKRSIDERLQRLNVSFEEIDTLLITHEHDDHIRSLAAVLRKSSLTCYMTNGTFQGIMSGSNQPLKNVLEQKRTEGSIILLNRLEKSILYQDVFLDDLLIQVLPTFHDALEPVGYKISAEEKVLFISQIQAMFIKHYMALFRMLIATF